MSTVALPLALYRAAQVRELDRIAIEDFGIAGLHLMGRAGASAYAVLRERWPQARRILIYCGTGNNGGDGFVLAELARQEGLDVTVLQVGDGAKLQGDALQAAEAWSRSGGMTAPLAARPAEPADVIVDAIFGTGLEREVEGEWRHAIDAINGHTAPVLAVDIPSGLHADSGMPLGAAVCAQVTVTFVGLKQGLFTGQARDYCGDVLFDDLQVPAEVYARLVPAAERIDSASLVRLLAPRRRAAHKGHYGHVLVIGGEVGMAGAARMAGEAAARVGAGLVSVATRSGHAPVIAAVRPELMVHGVDQPRDLLPLLERATVVAIGPGLGTSLWAQRLLGTVLDCRLPLVVDADALNLLACERQSRMNWVLTPHPGEAGRLLGQSSTNVQADRFAATDALTERFQAVCVLKGAGTLVKAPGSKVRVVQTGNPGMASGGMGDVLTGVIAGLIAQGLSLETAAALGAHLHGAAADRAAEKGERGLLAMDLMAELRRLVNPAQTS